MHYAIYAKFNIHVRMLAICSLDDTSYYVLYNVHTKEFLNPGTEYFISIGTYGYMYKYIKYKSETTYI